MSEVKLTAACDLKNVEFLIVNDNPVMQRIVKTILRAFDVNAPRVASSAEEAIQALRNMPSDIAIIDLDMEPVDGNQLIQQLRTEENSPAPFIQIIALTAYAEKELVTTSRDKGMNEFLLKPLSPMMLYKAIERIIKRPRPFVRIDNYVGPCRRRRHDDPKEDQREDEDVSFIPENTFPWNRNA
ncbi:response regulator [Kiloniella litopenaei]|uniref:response regulator n=1 Tax=Kiloniella litopenaei TaxID=1549748 RepID=UPI0012FE91DB|nr:response regulator [Kiloniella litopenaei]